MITPNLRVCCDNSKKNNNWSDLAYSINLLLSLKWLTVKVYSMSVKLLFFLLEYLLLEPVSYNNVYNDISISLKSKYCLNFSKTCEN